MALEDAAELAAFVQVAVLLRAGGCVALAGCKSSVCADGCVPPGRKSSVCADGCVALGRKSSVCADGCVPLGRKSSVCADGCVIVCSRLCSFTCRYNSCVSIQVKPTICWLYNEGELVPFFKGK
jgi:hypothetical protein